MVRNTHNIVYEENGESYVVVNKKVHSFFIGDCEDPYLMAGFPLAEWEKTDAGRFVKEHAIEQPVFYCEQNFARMGYNVAIYARLKPADLTFYFLKYHDK